MYMFIHILFKNKAVFRLFEFIHLVFLPYAINPAFADFTLIAHVGIYRIYGRYLPPVIYNANTGYTRK